MYYVYVLISKKDQRLYIGYTDNLKNRINKHKNGYVKATVNRRPLKLIYYEVYIKESDAKRREKYLKGGNGKTELKIQLQDILQELKYKYL